MQTFRVTSMFRPARAAVLALAGLLLTMTAVAPAGAASASGLAVNRTAAVSSTPVEAPAAAKQWYEQDVVFRAPSKRWCLDLFNTTIGKELSYGQREYGINLVWAADGDSFCFSKKGNPVLSDLTYGEPFAIKNKTGGFVKYGSREYGINLVWSSTAAYEWYIVGGTPGTEVNGDHFALWNKTSGKFLVYGSRTYGINLVWS